MKNNKRHANVMQDIYRASDDYVGKHRDELVVKMEALEANVKEETTYEQLIQMGGIISGLAYTMAPCPECGSLSVNRQGESNEQGN